MMMPANYSAVNAEVVYGGAVADYLPAAWTKSAAKTLSTNFITILSNTFTGVLVNATMGTMFGGAWGDGVDLFGTDGTVSKLFKNKRTTSKGVITGFADEEMNGLNKFMTALGVAASVYSLGTSNVKSIHDADVALGTDGDIAEDWR